MTLYLVGLGPSPLLLDMTRRAETCLRSADSVFLDDITAGGGPQRIAALKALVKCDVFLMGPPDTQRCSEILQYATTQNIVVATAGDALVATPGRFLLRLAGERGVESVIIPGVSMTTAAASLLGIDPSRCMTVVIDNPERLAEHELRQLESALDCSDAVILLAAGRRAEPEVAVWEQLQKKLQDFLIHTQNVCIDGGGTALVLRRVPETTR